MVPPRLQVSAGVKLRDLLNYLARHDDSESAYMGWSLPAFSWFIDQTIAGAISTGTHGSR
jgi:FAD/FMN-containing dehydrogenase